MPFVPPGYVWPSGRVEPAKPDKPAKPAEEDYQKRLAQRRKDYPDETAEYSAYMASFNPVNKITKPRDPDPIREIGKLERQGASSVKKERAEEAYRERLARRRKDYPDETPERSAYMASFNPVNKGTKPSLEPSRRWAKSHAEGLAAAVARVARGDRGST
jgi:hypothetical protein